MKIVISSGHGKYIRGASGTTPPGVPPQLDEVDEARKVVETVADLLRDMGHDVTTYHDDVSHSQGENLDRIVDFHNAQGAHDLDVSVHFNAYNGEAHGVECLYLTQEALAEKIADGIAAVGFTNRGPKYRNDLAFLNGTNEYAVLVETCFCDHTGDSELYREEFDAVCAGIAEAITGEQVPIAPPIEPPERPEWKPPERPDDEPNKLEMILKGYGDLIVTINGRIFQVGDKPNTSNKVALRIAAEGDLIVSINGQDFHGPFEPPGEPQHPPPLSTGLHRDIFATYFGGSGDPNYSAYPPYDSDGNGVFLDDTSLYVAVPWAVEEAQRERGIRVYNRANGRSEVGKVWDKGPWMVDDNYEASGTRPIAEQCYNSKTPLPRGPNAGKIPANPAGLDVSPAMYEALGMTDNGLVDWEWAEPEVS